MFLIFYIEILRYILLCVRFNWGAWGGRTSCSVKEVTGKTAGAVQRVNNLVCLLDEISTTAGFPAEWCEERGRSLVHWIREEEADASCFVGRGRGRQCSTSSSGQRKHLIGAGRPAGSMNGGCSGRTGTRWECSSECAARGGAVNACQTGGVGGARLWGLLTGLRAAERGAVPHAHGCGLDASVMLL